MATNITGLEITECRLITIPQCFKQLIALKNLSISHCPCLRKLNDCVLLPSLELLIIYNCRKLRIVKTTLITPINKINIINCPKLDKSIVQFLQSCVRDFMLR